jgi:NAD+ kinase
LKTSFQKIGLISKRCNEQIADTLQSLYQFLFEQHKSVVIESETAASNGIHHIPTVLESQFGYDCDLIIVVGGDGSLLTAAHNAVNFNVPMIGINRGRLGFLTDINPAEFQQKLLAVFKGDYWEEERFLLTLHLCTRNNKQVLATDHAVNDVVLKQGSIPHMLEFEIYINHQFVCKELSDGLIIATPTGSTAYALSGGGPILHPQLNAIVLMPMFSHTLSSRPIVVDGESEISILLTKNNKEAATLRCDGQNMLNPTFEHNIKIKKKQQPLRLIHPKDYDYFETLRTKLGWGRKNG